MHQKIENNFLGGLNTDVQDGFMKPEDWRYALNIRAGVAYAGMQGAVTNVKGNVEVAYSLPAGTNKCIGTYEDKQANTVIYFIYNSNGSHQILRYYPEAGTIELQIEYDFGWSDTTEITGIELVNGRLLYWLDPKPRKVNIEKATLVGKKKSWQVVLGKSLTDGQNFQVIVKNMAGVSLASINVSISAGSIEEELKELAAEINSGLSQYFTAEACDCHIDLTETQVNSYQVVFSFNGYMAIPHNWYGLNLTDRIFDRSKWMPLMEPEATYMQDETFLYNYVKNKVFQFRLKYRYDDFENSVLGVISQIPITNLQCDGTNAPEKNFLRVNFNDDGILAPEDLTILRDVSVLVREQNDGNWREVIQLRPCDFLDYSTDTLAWSAYYDFYNNIVSNAVSDDEVRRQYDDVPLVVEDALVVKNRAVLANVTKGYDAPECADVKWDVDVADTRSPKLYKITGIIRIFNPQMDNSGSIPANRSVEPNILERRSAIIYNDNHEYNGVKSPVFGGTVYAGGDLGIYSDHAFNRKFQLLPDGGWPVYCAGHKYMTVSKQRDMSVAGNIVSQRSDGSIDVANGGGLLSILSGFSANPNNSNYDIFSTFELLVPDGEYVIRLASHWCSFGDKLGKGFMYDLNAGIFYQKTSTYVWGTNNYPLGGGYSDNTEIKVTVNGGDVFIGEFFVSDTVVLDPFDHETLLISFSGYLYDNMGIVDPEQLALGVSVEKAVVSTSTYIDADTYLALWNSPTDHNGHFFTYFFNGIILAEFMLHNAIQIGSAQSPSPLPINTQLISSGAPYYYVEPHGESALSKLLSNSLSSISIDITDGTLYEFILPTNNPSARNDCSTVVVGRVLDDNNNPISGAIVVLTGGRYDTTDVNGEYRIIAWGDCRFPFPTVRSRLDYLVYALTYSCQPNYVNGNEYYCEITPIENNSLSYNPSNPFLVPDFIIDEGNNPTQKAHKRGGQYIYGLRYYDETGRFCSVVKAFEMYLPFITEDLNILCQQDKYNDPNQYAVGTYKYGKPTVNWYLDAAYKPPTWAKYYQWMRTKNSIYGRHLQWVANSVTYLSAVETDTTPEIQTSFQNSDAVAIKIQLSNIIDYKAQNPTSVVGYSYELGDRVRFIADREIDYSSGLNDYEIISYDDETQSIIIKNENSSLEIQSGSMIEIMNAKSITSPQEQIFYEVGEVFECTAPGTQGNEHSVTSGSFTNGDTYWRGRYIPVNDDATNYAAIYPVVVEDASVSDFYESESQDIGRAGIIDINFKQIHYPTMMQNSGIYVEGSAINGLSSFATTDYKELNRAFGAIKRIFYVGNTLISIHENKVVANYIELRSLSDSNETDGLLAISDAYFGNDRPLQSEYGCQHGKSAVQWNGLVYFLDASKGVVCRYDNNGMDAISDKGMRSYFRELCSDGVLTARAVFDPYYRQYTLTINTDSQSKTIGWDEERNRWSSEYSFVGEDYASVLRSIVSFKDGKLWLHDANTLRNNFYGVQYDSRVKIVVVSGTTRSTYHTIALQSVQDNPITNDWYASEISNEFSQASRIKKPHFRLKENIWCASFMRDTTDTSVTDPIINGRNLRSQTLTILLLNDSTDSVYLQRSITNAVQSERQ